MNIDTLRHFVSACECGTLTAVAAKAHLSRQAVSQGIRALEDECGAPLLRRGRGGVAPTEAGESLLPHARAILARHDAALAELRRHPMTQRLRIGFGQMTRMAWQWDLEEAYARAGGPALSLRLDTPDALFASLISRGLDAVVSNAPFSQKGYLRIPVLRRPSYVLVRRDVVPGGAEGIRPESLRGRTLLLHPNNPSYNRRLRRFFQDAGCALSYRYSVSPEITVILQEIRHDPACVYATSGLYSRLVSLPDDLLLAPLLNSGSRAAPSKDIFVRFRADHPDAAGIRRFAKWLSLHVQDSPKGDAP